MAIKELSEIGTDTTTEEIKQYAESLVAEIEQDRAGESSKSEPKSDAQITSEQAGIEQPDHKLAETNSGKDSATNDGEETGTDEEGLEWLTDDVKAEALAYGISEAELADFTSREEFDKVLRLFDKTALDAGRKAMAEAETGRNERGQFVKKEQPKSESKPPVSQDEGYKVSLDPDVYDEHIIGEFNRLRDHYESRLGALEAHFAEARAIQEEQRFDNLVDSLGHADLFGTTGKETAQELDRRKDLIVAVKAQMIGLEKLGRPAELSKQLVSRVANMVFGEELSKKLLKQRTRSISKQSNGRMGGSPTKPLPPSDNPRDHFDRLYREMERK